MRDRLRTARTALRTRQGLKAGLVVGAVVTLAATAIGFSIVAMPLFALAQIVEGDGRIDDPLLRNGLLHWALPFGLLIGVGTGTLIGWWVAKGGRLPDHTRTFTED